MRLLLVRHGATANNLEARFTGQSDIELSPLGVRQAERVAVALSAERLDAIVSSDLRRAWATAEAIAARHQMEPVAERDLREISMGAWEGATLEEVEARDLESLAQWQADSLTNTPPGGESVQAFLARVLGALERWRARYPEGRVLWVTHGGTIGVLVSHLLGMDLTRRWQLRRDNVSITELELGEEHAVLHRLNDTAHLREMTMEQAGERFQVL